MKFKTQGKGMSIDISFPCVFLLIMMFDRMKDVNWFNKIQNI